jgi:hypothetical protein
MRCQPLFIGRSTLLAIALPLVGAQLARLETTEDLCLEAVGGLSAVGAQNTHLLLGVTADAFRRGVYASQRAAQIARGAARQFDSVVAQLRRLQNRNLASEDDAFIDGLIKVFRQIEDEARALEKYAERGEPADLKAFEKARRDAAEALDVLLREEENAGATGRARPKNGT